MSIIIQNISNPAAPTGPQNYLVRINLKYIVTFVHNREDGLAECLRKAAAAVEGQDAQQVMNT